MRLSRQDLGTIAERFTATLERNGVASLKQVHRFLERDFKLDDSPDFISIRLRPSNGGVIVPAISYIRPLVGIPLELRINVPLNYSRVILKTYEHMSGYASEGIDLFGNVYQAKKLRSADFGEAVGEINRLATHAHE